MEPAIVDAPPVVAVMVVHRPDSPPGTTSDTSAGEPRWFDEALAALAAQDYSNLKFLVLVTGEPGDLPQQIRAGLPKAFVRAVDGNPGFGPAANDVIRLVDGENGFFCFLHDDVALRPDAIRLLVEEMYRSNAGIVGPKLLDWDSPRVLQHVGFGVDRFGEIDPIVDPGETDQEQHDAVRDVFALPSACLLVRADLFRSLGGFDRNISFHGEDVDLCWRAHLSGARVLVVPAAEARHREQLVARRPDLAHEALRARHRVRTVITLSGARRLPLLFVELAFFTFVQFLVDLVTGHGARGIAGVRAFVGIVPRLGSIIKRRRSLTTVRMVPDREVVGLQLRGSSRLAAYLRARDNRPTGDRGDGRGWRERAGAAGVIAWGCVILVVLAGARHFITDGVPAFGEFLPFPESPATILRSAASSWNPSGVGSESTPPIGLAVVAVASVFTAFRMGLLHTVSVVGLLLAGAAGVWRLSTAFSLTKARITAMVVYLAIPLSAQMMSMGRWSALAVAAALPWSLDSLRRFAGIEPGPSDDSGDDTVAISARSRVRIAAGGVAVCALATAFEPSYLLMLIAVSVVVAFATMLAGAPLRAAGHLLVAGAVAVAGGAVLDLAWLATFATDGGWAVIVGPAPPGDRGNTVFELLSFDLGNVTGSVVSLALYVTVVAGVLLGRGWRLGWTVRGGAMVVTFAWLAVLDDRGSLPMRLPEPGIVLVPVALGLALCAGCVVASFDLDIRGGTFGWRQPLGLLGVAAVVIGVVPAIFAVNSGRFDTPRTTMVDLTTQQLATGDDGDYRVLWLGDYRVLPAAATVLRPGVAFAITDGRSLDVAQTWAAPADGIPVGVPEALEAIAVGSTTRAGRLLAPWSIRYVIVPVVDGAVSTTAEPLPVPAGLVDALGDQLDLATMHSPPNVVMFENRAWVPVRSVLTTVGAESSRTAGAASLAQSDLSGAGPVMSGADHLDPATATVEAGTFHLAVAFERSWQLRLDGATISPRPAFGASMAYDLPNAGTVSVDHRDSARARVLFIMQATGWVVVLLAASSIRAPRRRRRRSSAVDVSLTPVLTLDQSDQLDEPETEPETETETVREPEIETETEPETVREPDDDATRASS